MKNYILLTPIKNEIKNLPVLKKTVFDQTILPCLWIIIDGNSDDGSYEFASNLFKGYDWIYLIKQKVFFGKEYSHKNFSQAVNESYEYCKEICNRTNIVYDYIGKIDATISICPNYFQALEEQMEADSGMVITSGIQCFFEPDGVVFGKTSTAALIGFSDIRLYRRSFFERMGGYPLTSSPDTLLLVKAQKSGLKVAVLDSVYFIDSRVGSTKIGVIKGAKLEGNSMYELGYHPLLMLLNMLYKSYRFYPHYRGLFVLLGYISHIGKPRQISDSVILHYFWHEKLIAIIREIFKKNLF